MSLVKHVVLALVAAVNPMTFPQHGYAASKVELDEVEFGFVNHDVYRDVSPQTVYETPQWKKGRSEQHPVCYTPRLLVKLSTLKQTSSYFGSVKIYAVILF